MQKSLKLNDGKETKELKIVLQPWELKKNRHTNKQEYSQVCILSKRNLVQISPDTFVLYTKLSHRVTLDTSALVVFFLSFTCLFFLFLFINISSTCRSLNPTCTPAVHCLIALSAHIPALFLQSFVMLSQYLCGVCVPACLLKKADPELCLYPFAISACYQTTWPM